MFPLDDAIQTLRLNLDDSSMGENFSSDEEKELTINEPISSDNENYSNFELPIGVIQLSKDKKLEWTSTPPRKQVRAMKQNLVENLNYGVPQNIKHQIFSPLTSFKQFITDDIISKITIATNIFLEKRNNKLKVDESDIWCWIGANFYLGLMKTKNASVQQLWNKERGLPFLSKSNKLLIPYKISYILN